MEIGEQNFPQQNEFFTDKETDVYRNTYQITYTTRLHPFLAMNDVQRKRQK